MTSKNKKTPYNQSEVFEFVPDETITTKEILELAELIRIGISGEVLRKASSPLKRYFFQIKK
jgi:hypothetical protein